MVHYLTLLAHYLLVMQGPAFSCTPTQLERKQEAAGMSVIPRQEVPGRWLPFNAAIIVTIV